MENLGDVLKRLGTRSISEGNPENYIEPSEGDINACSTCGGRGMLTLDVPVGHPAFGQVITCDCQKNRLEQEHSDRLLKYSNLGHLSRLTFSNLEPYGLNDDSENRTLFHAAEQTALEYAENPTGWLVLAGPHGMGKTHLAAAIATRCIERGQVVFFTDVPDLLDHLRSSFGPTSELSYNEFFEQVRNTPLLILDGLGSHSSTSWAEEKLRQTVNHRFSSNLPTVVTVTGNLQEIDQYILSRLQDPGISRVIHVGKPSANTGIKKGLVEPRMLKTMTFEAFDTRGNNPSSEERSSLRAAYNSSKTFSDNPDGWLTLSGETGVGKTHLAIAIAAEQIAAGKPVVFWFVPELMDYLRYTFNPDSPVTYDAVFEDIKNTPLLILDDLGRERGSTWAVEKLYQIIVHRHNARLPTVITSMMDFKDELDPITSRVQDGSISQLVPVMSRDYRNKRRRTNHKAK